MRDLGGLFTNKSLSLAPTCRLSVSHSITGFGVNGRLFDPELSGWLEPDGIPGLSPLGVPPRFDGKPALFEEKDTKSIRGSLKSKNEGKVKSKNKLDSILLLLKSTKKFFNPYSFYNYRHRTM